MLKPTFSIVPRDERKTRRVVGLRLLRSTDPKGPWLSRLFLVPANRLGRPTAAMAATTLKSGLEEVERDDDKRLPFLLTKVEIKLLGIAGVRPAFSRAVVGILR